MLQTLQASYLHKSRKRDKTASHNGGSLHRYLTDMILARTEPISPPWTAYEPNPRPTMSVDRTRADS